MPISILMPALSPTMEEGNISKWLKKEGDKINAGDLLAEIETDKAVMELEALEEGILFKILISEGAENIKINRAIAVLKEEDDSDQDLENFINSLEQKNDNINVEKAFVEENEQQNTKNEQHNSITQEIIESKKKIFITPLAKKLAEAEKIDYSLIQGSGPRGRIVKKDVINFGINTRKQEKSNVIQDKDFLFREEKISNIKKITAQRLSESKKNIPHFYLSLEAELDNLLLFRSRLNQKLLDQNVRISINDFIILAVAKLLKKFPSINSSWNNDKIIFYQNIDISVAVSTERGLMTPIIKNADQKKIVEISKEIKILAQKARENKLKLEEFQGGNISISNLGMYGIQNFYAIINPPQSCILSVGKLVKKPIVVRDEIQIRNIINLGISCDHRIVDGSLAAEFLSSCKEYLEFPELLLT
ncbi:MAG: pyruvate dehydrogenase complex dihydrolipoamide acetyltransferase [Rickettsia sp.]|nr:pyruvate dehydrogenase complex dihydrolipoamide acetyltransferase [Rickettsia sp.]